MDNEKDYQATLITYTTQLRDLFTVQEGASKAAGVTRGKHELPVETLAERAEKLADTSRELGSLTANFLESKRVSVREGAEMKMLSQAIAEIEIARTLFEAAEEEANEKKSGKVTRLSRAANGRRSFEDLIEVLETPLEAGIQPSLFSATRGEANRPSDPERAKTEFQEQVKSSLKSITKQTGKVGGHAMSSLLLMDAGLLVQGVSFVSKELGDWIDKVIAGATAVVKKLAVSALRLLMQAYDWILELLGKDVEESCRKQVKEWVDELKKDGAGDDEGLFDKLVNRIFTPDSINEEVSGWLATTRADIAALNQTSDAVRELANKYRVKTDKIDKLLKGIAFARKAPFINTPQGQLLIAAITLSVLGYTIYLGYDHVDSGRVNFYNRFGVNIPDRVEGIRETAQKALGAV
jgi:hypothetical protein